MKKNFIASPCLFLDFLSESQVLSSIFQKKFPYGYSRKFNKNLKLKLLLNNKRENAEKYFETILEEKA